MEELRVRFGLEGFVALHHPQRLLGDGIDLTRAPFPGRLAAPAYRFCHWAKKLSTVNPTGSML
jgi:hypothetical protein